MTLRRGSLAVEIADTPEQFIVGWARVDGCSERRHVPGEPPRKEQVPRGPVDVCVNDTLSNTRGRRGGSTLADLLTIAGTPPAFVTSVFPVDAGVAAGLAYRADLAAG